MNNLKEMVEILLWGYSLNIKLTGEHVTVLQVIVKEQINHRDFLTTNL